MHVPEYLSYSDHVSWPCSNYLTFFPTRELKIIILHPFVNAAEVKFKYVNLRRHKQPGKRGHIVAETLLLMTFPCARKLGNICRGHKMFRTKSETVVSRTQNWCSQQMLRARANGETFLSATMCPRLPEPLILLN